MKTSKEIRQDFISFFAKRGHQFIHSSPVVPKDDPTLLFVNAGMNQFKDIFLGKGSRDYERAVNSQKCIRASGKHNDLEDVGRDNYHHTFFEMLGNWSFGEYFKKEAIEWAWELLTQVWGIDPSRLHATVFGGDPQDGLEPDEESANLWRTCTSINPEQIHYCNKKHNFWEMGDTGPCGPCNEIHIDLTPDQSGHSLINKDDSRVIEIWNLVFIQFNRNKEGMLSVLPTHGVDTGLGLERICQVLQQVDSNYSTDLFSPILEKIAAITGISDAEGEIGVAFRVIADHLRSLSFAIADGAIPANEGRGYVLRRILRRATRFGRILGMERPFISQLVPTLVEIMGESFPELQAQQKYIMGVIDAEETSFGQTLDRGLELFSQMLQSVEVEETKILPGTNAFKLYDTYGFPADLTKLLCEERGISVDTIGFTTLMEKQRQRAREATKFQWEQEEWVILKEGKHSHFVGYTQFAIDSQIRKYTKDTKNRWLLVLKQTPFYAESGGQVADQGIIVQGKLIWKVVDVRKEGDHIVHVCTGDSLPQKGTVQAQIDRDWRSSTTCNHTGTHMLQSALKTVLGSHVNQAGSVVHPEYLRFDFTHFEKVTPQQMEQIEQIINRKIRANVVLHIYETNYQDAIESGVLGLFGEKYGDQVRVVTMPEFSQELCGGCHVKATGELGRFRIISESAIAAGVRRIVAVTGEKAEEIERVEAQAIQSLRQLLNVSTEGMVASVSQLIESKRFLEKELQEYKKKSASGDANQWIQQAQSIAGVPFIVKQFSLDSTEELRSIGDTIRKGLKGIAVLAAEIQGKFTLLCVLSEEIVAKKAKASELVNQVAFLVDGRGGGKPHMAQAGIKSPEKLLNALDQVPSIVEKYLNSLECK